MPRQKEAVQTLEKGNVYFFYRPKVEEEAPEGLEDVQRMYMILAPDGEERFRETVIGRKKLPEPEASYIITVKNPERGQPVNAGLSEEQQAEFPKKLMEKFRDRKFAEVDPPDFLNYEGAEFVLVAASADLEEELGLKLDTEREKESSANIFQELRLEKSQRPTEPLFKGEWK